MGKQETPPLSVEQMKGLLIGNSIPSHGKDTGDHSIFEDMIMQASDPKVVDQAAAELRGIPTPKKH